VLRSLALILSHMFFRSITASSSLQSKTPLEKESIQKPTLWVANHPNGILDPIVAYAFYPLEAVSQARLRPISKSTLFNHPILGFFLKVSRAIPVFRKQDSHQAETNDPTDIHAQNNLAFRSVAHAFQEKSHVFIFPEGMSHDLPHLTPFRSGAARMILQAFFEGLQEIVLQPLVIEYLEKDTFRSRVFLEQGNPISLLAKDFQIDSIGSPLWHAKKDALEELVSQSLTKICLQFESWEYRHNLFLLFVLWNKREPQTLSELRTCYTKWKPALESKQNFDLQMNLSLLRAVLNECKIRAADYLYGVEFLENLKPKMKHFKKHAFSLLLQILVYPFSFAAQIFWRLPLRITNVLAVNTTSERDVLGTMRLAFGILILPLWLVGIFFLLWAFGLDHFSLSFWYPLSIFVCTGIAKYRFEHTTSARLLRVLYIRYVRRETWKELNENWHNASVWIAKNADSL
jgi:1-acyl-sn-glycerol-3-phosphate acyltransferase